MLDLHLSVGGDKLGLMSHLSPRVEVLGHFLGCIPPTIAFPKRLIENMARHCH